jgi:hypothetical protein
MPPQLNRIVSSRSPSSYSGADWIGKLSKNINSVDAELDKVAGLEFGKTDVHDEVPQGEGAVRQLAAVRAVVRGRTSPDQPVVACPGPEVFPHLQRAALLTILYRQVEKHYTPEVRRSTLHAGHTRQRKTSALARIRQAYLHRHPSLFSSSQSQAISIAARAGDNTSGAYDALT